MHNDPDPLMLLATVDGHSAWYVSGDDSRRMKWEDELVRSGPPLSSYDRAAWQKANGVEGPFVLVTDQSGRIVGGHGAGVSRTRSLPGYRVLRIRRFRGGPTPSAMRAAVTGFAELARCYRRVLRLNLEVFDADPRIRADISSACRGAGYRVSTTLSYARTLIIRLDRSDEELLAEFHATARRHIRAVDRNPVAIATISNPLFGPRLDALLRETMSRTGGTHMPLDGPQLIQYCSERPDQARLVGLFRNDDQSIAGLLAFALGLHHGDHVEYATAASTRATDLKLPLAYGLAWDLMRWGRGRGAAWFDFGGITEGSHESDDPRGGISDFKRYFSREVSEVGAEWLYEPRPRLARLAAAMARGRAWAQRR